MRNSQIKLYSIKSHNKDRNFLSFMSYYLAVKIETTFILVSC